MIASNTLRVPRIESRIQVIRGLRVMLDVDLAALYGVQTKRLNEQVKRNRDRFPSDFLFQLTADEKTEVVANCDHLQNLKFSKALPFAFTEHGAIQAANVLASSLISYAVSQAKATVGQLNLTLEICRALPIPMPPEKEQTEIIRRVDTLFALADRIEARCSAARTQAQRLTPLVLAKAFRGELVPQDPNDEPASALLARIASSNTVVAGKNRRKVPVALKERA